jgi:hypothetical protein
MSRFVDNRLKDGSKVVSPTHPPHFTPQKHYYLYVSGTHTFQKSTLVRGLGTCSEFQVKNAN